MTDTPDKPTPPAPPGETDAPPPPPPPAADPVESAPIPLPLLPAEPPLPDTLGILPVRNTVVFPHAVMPMTVGRERSKRLLQETLPHNKIIGILTQKNGEQEDPAAKDLNTIGTLASVLKLLRMPDGSQTVVIQGIMRFRVVEFVQTEPYLKARIERVADVTDPARAKELDALVLHVKTNAKQLIQKSESIPDEAALMLENIEAPGGIADFLAANLDITLEEKQELLSTSSVEKRMERLSQLLVHKNEMLNLSHKIHEQVRSGIDKTQREYYLREQMKAIQEELGVADEKNEIEELRKAVKDAGMPADVLKEAERELARMERIPTASPEYSVSRTYVEWLTELPWKKGTRDRMNIGRAERILHEDHYDLEKIKKRILEYLAVRKLKKDGKGPILCLVGPPGVGKTSLGKSIARALGRKFIRVSLGGMHDEAEIRGHRRTYIGALPGRILQELRKAGSNNPVFMLDEIDKVGKDWRGDPASALLEVLDPAQNATFTDHYLDVPFDLSKCMFIATANLMDPVPEPLKDRMEVLELTGYTEDEKVQIAVKYLIPRQLSENGLKKGQVQFKDDALREIIRRYTREAGVRNLERSIGSVCRAVAAKVAKGETRGPVTAAAGDVAGYLGIPQFEAEVRDRTGIPGVATGLAWTPFGGDILFIESTSMPGKGGVSLTGQLGEVMKESAQAAMSYVRSHSREMGVDVARLAKTDVHVHIPAGAVPKDGPSAGVAMLTSLVSLLTSRPVRSDVAMTGEITLRGLVLPIGGVKEKTLAAHRAGMREVILPERNRKDFEDIPESVRKELTFHFVENVGQVLGIALGARKRAAAGNGVAGQSPSAGRKAKPAKAPRPSAATPGAKA